MLDATTTPAAIFGGDEDAHDHAAEVAGVLNTGGFQRAMTFGAWVWARRQRPTAGWLRG